MELALNAALLKICREAWDLALVFCLYCILEPQLKLSTQHPMMQKGQGTMPAIEKFGGGQRRHKCVNRSFQFDVTSIGTETCTGDSKDTETASDTNCRHFPSDIIWKKAIRKRMRSPCGLHGSSKNVVFAWEPHASQQKLLRCPPIAQVPGEMKKMTGLRK